MLVRPLALATLMLTLRMPGPRLHVVQHVVDMSEERAKLLLTRLHDQNSLFRSTTVVHGRA